MGIQEHPTKRKSGRRREKLGRKMVDKEKTRATGRRGEWMEKNTKPFFSFFKNKYYWINKGHFRYLLLQLYFLCKIKNIFSNDSMNHSYAILSDIITNIYKLVA